MTAPIQQGYPDWGRQFSQAQVLEINDNNVTKTNNFFYPNRYVGNAQWLHVWANPITVPVTFGLRFWGDKTNTIIMDTYNIDVPALGVARQPVPILGPYMDAFANNPALGAFSYTFQVWRMPSRGAFAGSQITQHLINDTNLGIGAGATVVVQSQHVAEGHAYWNVSISSTPWEARLEAVDASGTITILDRINNNHDREQRPVWLPPMAIQVRLINAGGAAAYDAFMSRSFNGF